MSLELIIGPMFSGKTSLLISKIEIFCLTGKKCVIVKSSIDTRNESVKTHRDLVYKGNVLTLSNFEDISVLDQYDVIGIDEGHFFNGIELTKAVEQLKEKIIFIAMLKSTFKREPFPDLEWLYARSTNIVMCKAVCEICKQYVATNTKRRNTNISETIFVGGKELYYPCCDKCWSINSV
jgi:thymidine kinase